MKVKEEKGLGNKQSWISEGECEMWFSFKIQMKGEGTSNLGNSHEFSSSWIWKIICYWTGWAFCVVCKLQENYLEITWHEFTSRCLTCCYFFWSFVVIPGKNLGSHTQVNINGDGGISQKNNPTEEVRRPPVYSDHISTRSSVHLRKTGFRLYFLFFFHKVMLYTFNYSWYQNM